MSENDLFCICLGERVGVTVVLPSIYLSIHVYQANLINLSNSFPCPLTIKPLRCVDFMFLRVIIVRSLVIPSHFLLDFTSYLRETFIFIGLIVKVTQNCKGDEHFPQR